MGDVILTTPVLSALRTAYPEARITYLAETPFAELLRPHPDVDELLVLDRSKRGSMFRIYSHIFRSKFDVAIDLFGNPRSAGLTRLSGARLRIGGNFRGRKKAYTHCIVDDGQPKTAVQFHLQYLKPLEIPAPAVDPYITVTPEEEAWARQYLADLGYRSDRPLVGIHPGASWPAKQWLPERFAGVANRLAADGKQVLFTMGPGEDEHLEMVIRWCDFPIAQPEVLPLRKLAAVLRECTVYVSNDCGPMHLAPAVGTRTVGIFGPGWPDVWFPYAREAGHRLVYHQVDCSGCDPDHCKKLDCMKSIPVETVVGAVREALAHEPA